MSNDKYIQARLTLCLFLKSEAETKGITQQQIADKCGWHQQTVQRMLSGKFAPSLDNFIKLADAIGVNFFMESKDSPTENNQEFEKAMTEIGRRKITDTDKLN
jgi:transcriptional regulator with XRE-family HTH domain